MDTNKLLKKLEEIKVDAYNNVSSSEKDSPLQVESETEFMLDEDAKGEDVKIERTKGEKFKLPDTLSRTTPMAGPTKHNPSEKVYVTDGTIKSYNPIQMKLDIMRWESLAKHLPEEIDMDKLKRGQEEALQMAQEYLDDLMDMPEHMRDDFWTAEVEQAKAFIEDLEKMLYKAVLKNDPMTTAALLIEEGPRNDKEKDIFLMLEDSYSRCDVA